MRAVVVEGLETKVDIEMTADGWTFPVTARFDRVERRGGKLFVLDYKTGAREKSVGIAFRKPGADDAKNKIRLDPDNRETRNKAIGSSGALSTCSPPPAPTASNPRMEMVS